MTVDQRMLRRIAGLLKARLPDAALEGLDDPRGARGRRWKKLGPLVRLPVVAMLAGLESFAEAEALSAEMALPMRRLLGIPRRIPDTTLRTTAARLDPDALRESLRAQAKAAHRRKALQPLGLPFGMVAIDGKTTAIGAWDERYAQKQVHSCGEGASGLVRTMTCSLVSSRAKVCLDASPIPPATNEMGHFRTAVTQLQADYGRLELYRLVSADAGSCSEANARLVVEEHGLHYLFRLNADQPTLYREARHLLGRQGAKQALAETTDIRGKEAVTRRLYLTTELAGWLQWDHLQTVLRIETEKRDADTGKLLEEKDDEEKNRYFLSSLPAEELSPEQWLLVGRLHWGVENECHNTWDKCFREDTHPWFESGHDAPQGALVVMLLRRIAYNMLTLFRSVTQRSPEKRQTPWKDLMRWVYNTLIAATAADVDGLRSSRLRTVASVA